MPQIRYDPNANFAGTDTVRYRITNPDRSFSEGELEVTVLPPTAANDVSFLMKDPVATDVVGYWRYENPLGIEFFEVALGSPNSATGRAVSISDGLPGSADDGHAYYTGLDYAEPIVGVQHDGIVFITGRHLTYPFYWGKQDAQPNENILDHTQMTAAGNGGVHWADQGAANSPHLPTGRCIAAWDNRVWVANTIENGVAYPSRLRYSVLQNGANWNELDYIDIDIGESGDQIQGLVVHGEVLVVLKERAMYLVLPQSDPQVPYSVVNVSRDTGCSGPYAVCPSPVGAWYWDPGKGLMLWTGRDPQDASTNIYRDIEDGSISPDDVHIGWDDERVWCSVVRDGERVNLVYSPLLQPGGSWTLSTPAVLAPRPYVGFDGHRSVAFMPSTGRWVTIDNTQAVDDYGAGDVAVASRWCTPWMDGGAFFRRKRWRRPQFLMGSSGVDAEVTVSVMKNHAATAVRTFGIDAAVGESKEATLDRGVSLGEAEAVLLRVDGPKTAARWRLEKLAMKFVNRPDR